MAAAPLEPAQRKRILRVIFISLLLDLISFTFILPLFPALLSFYRDLEAATADSPPTLLSGILHYLNAYKHAFSRPISDRYDIVLLGGALGSLFSLCQAVASPIIGRLSDRHGRRTALLWSMAGNLASVALWVAATDFRTFLASRVVGGLSEGNVQLATAMAADVSTDAQRGATMALVGACFSVAFTFGPALGAALARTTIMVANPFATAAAFSLALILTETVYLYLYLPETLPAARGGADRGSKDPPTTTTTTTTTTVPASARAPAAPPRTNSHALLNATHFLFVLFFSGMEYSLPFMTWDLFAYTSPQSGRLLGYVGLVASALQGGVTRRLHPLRVVRTGVVACAAAFFLLARVRTEAALYAAATLLAVTTATVVTGLNSLSSFEAGEAERGGKLGNHRSWGQMGRSLGPLLFCTLYWWAGRDVAYAVGGAGMLAVAALVFTCLRAPPKSLVTDSAGNAAAPAPVVVVDGKPKAKKRA